MFSIIDAIPPMAMDNIVHRERVSVVGIGYNGGDRSFTQQVDGFIKIIAPVKAFVVQKNQCAYFMNIGTVDFTYRHNRQPGTLDIMCGLWCTQVSYNSILHFQIQIFFGKHARRYDSISRYGSQTQVMVAFG